MFLSPLLTNLVVSSLHFNELIHKLVKSWDSLLKALSLSDLLNDLLGLAIVFEDITLDQLPVIKDTLRGGTAAGCLAESISQSKRLADRQMCLHIDNRHTRHWLLTDDFSSFLTHQLVDATYCIFWCLDLT